MGDTQRLRELDREIPSLRLRIRSTEKSIKHHRNKQAEIAEVWAEKLALLKSELSRKISEKTKLARTIKSGAGELKSHMLNARQKKDNSVRKINESSKLKEKRISLVSGGLPGLGKKK